ncbi:MAG TPA: invasion associated locus B family protein [Rhizomicrobium sp.]|nr:invasion associated locus B family protein [Rhizomicrobium sp.]
MKIERLIIGGAALLVGLLLGWMVRGVTTYNAHQASIATYDDWRVACPAADTGADNKDAAAAAHCELSTDVIDKSQSTPNAVARATITTDKDGKQMIGFVLPFGVALEAGMGLKIGKDPVKVYQYRTCNSIGCIVTTPFDDKLASSLKGTDDAAVMFAGLDGKAVSVPISFKGYQQSMSAWKSSEARRNSWFWRLWS